MIKKSVTLEYIKDYLLDCETGMSDIVGWINGVFEDIKIVDVLGVIEEKERIYIGVEIITNDYPFGIIVHFNLLNTWDFIYKDEMIDIQDIISNSLIEKLLITEEN